jgi:NAD(P)-dependent dehydrogenase (short-subunit alcohol dehydrogenase family)
MIMSDQIRQEGLKKMEISGQRVIIMGGTSGVGLATARALSEMGANVIVTGRQKEKLASALAQLGDKAQGQAVDAASPESVNNFFKETGAFDHLVLCLSGGGGGGAFPTLDLGALRLGFEGKFWAQIQTAQASLATLRSGGSITFLSSISARMGNPGTAGLAAINGALEAMIPALALELKPTRINAVSPGVIDTPWWDRMPSAQREAYFQQLATTTPVGRVGKPEEVAQAITFLITNSFMTGTIIECDGGMHLK